MKFRLLLPLILICNICFGRNNFAKVGDTLFPIKENPGYYGAQYTDQQIYTLMFGGGAPSTRSTVDIKSAQAPYNYATYTARLAYMYNTLGMRQNVLFADANPYNGVYVGQSDSLTTGGNRAWTPTGLYANPFNGDSSINATNVWATYIGNLITNYGAYFDYIQCWNEPDFSYTSDAYLTSAQSATSWQVREPTPDELPNLYTTLEDYVQLCKITRQVCNHLKPSLKVITGGLGYAWFYQWCLRRGIAQWVDVVDFHEYPFYQWTYCLWTGSACSTTGGAMRNSDMAAHLVDSAMNYFRQIETNESATHKPFSSTEIAVPRWSFPLNTSSAAFPNNKDFGSNAMQENFLIKSINVLMQDTLIFYTAYQTGEGANYQDVSSGNPFVAMGLYDNLSAAGVVGHEVKTPQGLALTAFQNLFGNYKINLTKPTLNTGTLGAEWDSSTNKAYCVWAVTTHDTVESGSGTFALPAGLTFKEYDREGNLLSASISGTVNLSAAPVYLFQIAGATNLPPTVTPGANQNLSATSGTLTGTAVANTGSITSTAWTQVSGPNTAAITTPASLTTTITGLITGTYVFKLTATNSVPLSASNNTTVTVSIAPVAPTAVITPSATTVQLPLDSVSLNGAGSHDNNTGGTITSYKWTQVSGPTSTIRLPSAVTTNVIMPTAGTYVYQLVVTNSGGITSAATTVSISVTPAVLLPITAVIMASGIITLPVTTVVLNGTASTEPNANSGINSWQWQLITVPAGSGASIQSPTQSITNLVNAIPGTYTIKLTIRDTNNLTNSVTATITVNSNQILTNKVVKSVH
jgi:hypothetical protein